MNGTKYITTTEYAKKHGLSRMHVNRLIRTGKLPATRVGKVWMILGEGEQRGFEKTTSLQKWNKLIEETLHKKMKIETSKDRELLYARLNGLGLPHERCLAFQINRFPSKHEFSVAVGRIGIPYWLSIVPNPEKKELNRLTKLGLISIEEGWKYINDIEAKNDYKVIVSQYPDETDFKGTALVSKDGKGMAEFITGDRHYIMTRGFTLTDPMLFDQDNIKRFSRTVSPAKQRKLYNLLRGIYGHLELQYARIEGKRKYTFFDYNDEEAYVEINDIWGDLIGFFKKKRKNTSRVIWGLPASLGSAKGRCVVVHHETISFVGLADEFKKGDILISDTTTPEMTALMGKASAIVTDLGGVTSHAAIVCRELKIPAIVGTEKATEMFRTGDLVEVNANKGEIKLVERAD